jgi:hypothetical protein
MEFSSLNTLRGNRSSISITAETVNNPQNKKLPHQKKQHCLTAFLAALVFYVFPDIGSIKSIYYT